MKRRARRYAQVLLTEAEELVDGMRPPEFPDGG